MPAYITEIGTAVPTNAFEQSEIADFMALASQLDALETRKLKALYRSTKIQTRHSVLSDYGKASDFEFYPNTPNFEPFPTVSKRMEEYKRQALPLSLAAVSHIQNLEDITHLITVSCTGLYAPGLDIELVKALNLDYHVQRTAINFMGCYGAFNGLKVAQAIVSSNPSAKVLMVSIEHCTLHFQKKKDENNLLSNALFADGAAAVVIESKPRGLCLKIKGFHCDLLPEGHNDMAWYVSDLGFEMILSSYVPKLVKGGITQLINKLRAKIGIKKFDLFALHPGGKAILEAIEVELGITKNDNRFAYQILKDYGNMSSATVLFVLQKLLQNSTSIDHKKNVLSAAFGPGLTLESAVFEVINQNN